MKSEAGASPARDVPPDVIISCLPPINDGRPDTAYLEFLAKKRKRNW